MIGQKLSTVLDQSPDLIVTTDNNGRITEFNRGATRLTGRSRQEMVGRSSEALLGADAASWIDRVRNRRRITKHAVSLSKADGGELNLELNMAALTDPEGHVDGTVWVGRDVTELRSAQLQLLQAKKLSSIGEVISGVAHELNNPLSGVLGFSQLLQARHGDGPLSRELDRIHDSALRCQKIVKNLLSSLPRAQAGTPLPRAQRHCREDGRAGDATNWTSTTSRSCWTCSPIYPRRCSTSTRSSRSC